jgi:predicted Zn-dependent peptidase
MRFRALAAALVAGVCLEGSARAQAVDPLGLPAEKVVLANGLRVLLTPDPQARVASVTVSYGAGAADDPDGLQGLAHLTEHLVAEGTSHVPDVFRALTLAGASDMNAETSLDGTTYFETVPPEHLDTALWIESDRMAFAEGAVSDARVAAARPVVANELRDRIRDASLAAVRPLVLAEIFPPWHPYASSTGDGGDIARIGAGDVRAFVRTWYRPSNATLAIAGAFDRDSTLAAVNRFFGTLPSSALPARPALPEWSLPGAWLRIHANTTDDHVQFAWHTPAFGTRDDAALDLASAMLTAADGRLVRALVTSHLAKGVTARQSSMLRDSVFVIDATLTPGADVDAVIHETEAAVEELASKPEPIEAERANELWKLRTLNELESAWDRARLLVNAERSGESPGPGFAWGLRRYEALGASDVARAVRAHLVPLHRVVAVVFADPRAPFRGVLIRRQQVTP